MRYGLIGATGRMGQEIRKAFEGHVLCLTVNTQKTWCDETRPEVIVDFSHRSSLSDTIELCKKHESALVIGTTGLNDEDFLMLKELARKVPVIQSYNFSFGVNALKIILASYSELFKDWD